MPVGFPKKTFCYGRSVPRRRIPHRAGKGQVSTNSLSISDVKKVVYSYQEPEVTNQLYAFGSVLLEEIQDRAKQIDAKAVMVLGWSLAVLAFWFTQAKEIRGFIEFILAAISAVLALLAVVFSYKARKISERYLNRIFSSAI